MNSYSRCDIINYFIENRNYKKYLEIGVFDGKNIENVICENKMGVDPSPICSKETLEKYIIKTTSDNFFKLLDEDSSNENKFDIIFIDGDHHYQQVIKDIYNSLKHLSENGIILLHDIYCCTEIYMSSAELENQIGYIGDGFNAFIQMIMLNELDHKYNVYFTAVDGVGAIDTQNTLEIFKNDNILDKYIDLIEYQINYFNDNKIDRNNKDILRIVLSSFTLDYLTYKQNIQWLYPLCNINQLKLKHSNVEPQMNNMSEIINGYKNKLI